MNDNTGKAISPPARGHGWRMWLMALGLALTVSWTPPGASTPAQEIRVAGGSASTAAKAQEPSPSALNPCEVQEKNEVTPTTPYIKSIYADITLVVRDLESCLQREAILASDLRPALDGTMLPELVPVAGPAHQNYVKFTLKIDPYDKDDRARWAKIIRAMRQSKEGVNFTLSNAKTGQLFASRERLRINLYPGYTPYVIAGLVAILVGLVYLGINSNMLRDNPGAESDPNAQYPFSLGRVQMAFWFYLVIAGYLYIWLLTGQSYTPTGSVLALLGISSATGFAAAIVDRSKVSEAAGKRTELEIQKQTLDSQVSELEATHPPDGSEGGKKLLEMKYTRAQVSLQLANTPRPAPSRSKNFFQDLFCDKDGVSFHRFQIVVWTLVLGVVFIKAVDLDLAMPDFDATLLGLMGLSSGTYIGFKFPEKPK